jgi:hypothetical protein
MLALGIGGESLIGGEAHIAALAAGYWPYRYHAIASRLTPIITVRVAADASVNSQSIASHVT